MVAKFQNEQMLHDEFYISNITDVDNDLMKNDESQKIDDIEIEDTCLENKISYSTYSVICEHLYNDIKNDNSISNYIIRLLLEMREVINNTKNKNIVISRLLNQTKKYENMFTEMKESSNTSLNEPFKFIINNLLNETKL